MHSEPKHRVAILVACHDDGATIGETIDSLRGEPDTELVIVDDGSTDGKSLEVLAGLERDGVTVLRQPNSGPASAWMRGLAATTAAYVLPFSSDDILVTGATAVLADALDADPDAAAVWGDMHTFGAASAYVPTAPALCPWHTTYVNCIPGIAMFRRDRLLEAGGWQMRTGIEDWDLWMRLAARGARGVHVPEVVFRYRRDAGGRFRGRVRAFEGFYEELRRRNADLFARRPETKAASPAPASLRLLLPIADRLPVSRLLRVQLCDLLTLVFWGAGPRRTARIVLQGLAFRARLLGGRGRSGRIGARGG
jgi:glycosyltransferase involved in cell wall biosynthesis